MHTAAYRANALLTYAGTALALLAALASLTGVKTSCIVLSATSGKTLNATQRMRRLMAPVITIGPREAGQNGATLPP